MLATRNISRLSNLVKFSRRNYGLPASAIGVGTDPRKDKTVQLTPLRGVNIIHDPLLSKGTAFSIAERERLSIRGLVPPRCQEMDKQLLRIKRNLDALETPLAKFVFLSALQDRNEILFYKLLINHLDELSGIIYTPTGKVHIHTRFFFTLIFPWFSLNIFFIFIIQLVKHVQSLILFIVVLVVCTFLLRIEVPCLLWYTTGLTMKWMLLLLLTVQESWD